MHSWSLKASGCVCERMCVGGVEGVGRPASAAGEHNTGRSGHQYDQSDANCCQRSTSLVAGLLAPLIRLRFVRRPHFGR